MASYHCGGDSRDRVGWTRPQSWRVVVDGERDRTSTARTMVEVKSVQADQQANRSRNASGLAGRWFRQENSDSMMVQATVGKQILEGSNGSLSWAI